MPNQIHQLAAIMFTDIVGYTALMDKDEEAAFALLEKNRSIHKPLIKKFHGKFLKEMGDGILASFSTVTDVVYCAGAIQQACQNEPDLKLRIGIHQGEVVFEGEDVFGSGVNIASRLEPLAPIGGILVSESVVRNIENKKGIETKFLREETLKNVKHPVKIYQVKVEGIKTPASAPAQPTDDKPKGGDRKGVLIGAGAILLILLALVFYQYQSNESSTPAQTISEVETEIDKSIAVLPLKYLSANQEKKYWADGITEALTSHLSKIKGLRVLPRTSAEKYRNPDKTAREIGDELNVTFLIEGSLQLEEENKIRLTIQLVNAREERHLFAEEYDREVKDIFKVQSSIAKLIAKEIEVIITPKEKELIEKIPTTNLTAYDLYLKASSEPDIEKATILFNLVLDLDSTFALAYTGLAWRYWRKYYWDTYFKENFLDSALMLANIALSYDDQLNQAYHVKGSYFQVKGQYDDALQNYEKVVDINPNAADIWWAMSHLYRRKNELIKALTCLKKADDIDYNQYHENVINMVGWWLNQVGLFDKSKDYFNQVYSMRADSLGNIDSLGYKRAVMSSQTNTISDTLVALDEIAYGRGDSMSTGILNTLGYQAMFRGNYKEAYFYLKRMNNLIEERGEFELIRLHRLGFISWQLGKYEEAEKYLNTQMRNCMESIRLKRPYGLRNAYYDLAGIYAFKGEKEKAYENLEKFAIDDFYAMWVINLAINDPMFNEIRDEPRFQQIIQNMEAKNLEKREKVRIWMEENDML